nr:hypothetical protein L203_04312 [Cryptococcus depauperatus CBS 7841]
MDGSPLSHRRSHSPGRDDGLDASTRWVDVFTQLVNDHNHVGAGLGTQSRPYVCSFGACDKAFARKSDLARHFKIHTNDRAFVCTYRGCGKSFIQRSALTVHYRVHTGERPHHCETCNKAFADSSSLARHRRIHTGKRPYTCHAPGCGKPFARRNTLLKHFKRQHPDMPPPSTSAQRPSIHVPVGSSLSRASSGSFLSQSSVNGDAYSTSPSSMGAHGFPSHTPEGSAYPFHSGFPGQVLGPPGSQQPIIFQGTGGVRPHFHQSPIHSGSATLTPISSTGATFANGPGPQTPASPNAGRSKYPSIHTHNLAPGQYPSPLSAYPHAGYPLTRFPGEGGVMWNRSLSVPGEPRFHSAHEASQWSGGNVGGGFHASQLSVPHTPTHLTYPYHMPPPQKSATQPVPSARSHQSSLSDDEGDEPLVSVSEAPPTFTLQPPQGMSVPMTSIGHNMNLPTSGSQMVMSHSYNNGRLHSAPPSIHRFNSMPSVPTIHSWDNVENTYQSHSVGSAKSADEEWEELEKEMISREASVGVDKETTPSTEERKTPKDNESINHWGQPIEFPAHPDGEHRKHAFSDGTTAMPTLVNSMHSAPNGTLPPVHVFSGQQRPMSLTPINPSHMYATPMTPAQAWNDHFRAPAMLGRGWPSQHSPLGKENSGDDSADSITLTTPKDWANRKESQSVTAVGLGIANVHFGEPPGIVKDSDEVLNEYMTEESEEDIQEEDDDSDEEFVLGRKPRRSAKKVGVAKKSRGVKGIAKRRRA